MTPFDAYRLYVAIKLHMTSDGYDVVKYCGKVRSISPAAFEQRNDKWSFVALSKKFPNEDQLSLFLACNHLSGSPYIRDLIHVPDYQDRYLRHLKIRESLNYTVEQDWKYLLEQFPHPMDMLAVHSGQWPPLAQEVQYRKITWETVCVMGMIMGFFPMWQKQVTDTIIWPTFYRSLTKFSSFVTFDHDAMKARLIHTIRLTT